MNASIVAVQNTIEKDKFGKKTLIWQAFYTCGERSRTFITNESLDATLCLYKCLKMLLLPPITRCLLSSGRI